MSLFNKIRILRSIIRSVLVPAYASKLLEQRLNEKGHEIFIDHNYVVNDTKFEKYNRLTGPGIISGSELGAFTYLQSYTNIACASIGRFCSVGPYTSIANGEHPTNLMSTHPVFFSEIYFWPRYKFVKEKIFEQHRKVVIGHDVWIGANCYIKDGISIGTGSIVAAGSIVTKDVPPYSIIGGVPAKIIRARFSEKVIELLLRSEWWFLEIGQLEKLKHFFLVPLGEKLVEDFINEIQQLKQNK